MKITLQNLKDSIQGSYEAYKESLDEAQLVDDLYHNRQYTQKQIHKLMLREQPIETFNIIKAFTRLLQGYFSTQVNTVVIKPLKQDSVESAGVLNDLVNDVINRNQFPTIYDDLKKDLMLSGLMCTYVDVVDTGERDQFGRPKYSIMIDRVPPKEVKLDPLSRSADYSDASFMHRHKWLSEDDTIEKFGAAMLKKLIPNNNFLGFEDTDLESLDVETTSVDNYYLIVHSIIKDRGKYFSVFWADTIIISKKEITYKEVKFPYRIQKFADTTKAEYYGIFREVIESQNAINQALLKIQLYINSERIFYNTDAVANRDEFAKHLARLEGLIPVEDINGIKIDKLERTIQEQYVVIDKTLDRIQRVLGINDSFLGMAFASDSGAKVNIQKASSIVTLRYLNIKLEQFYKLLGKDILYLIKQYYFASDVLRISDSYESNRWLELNKPLVIPTGATLPDGTPEMRLVFEEYLDPATGKPMEDEEGNVVMSPIPTLGSDITFSECDLEIATSSFNDEDEEAAKVLNAIINGTAGQLLAQVNPSGYFVLASRLASSSKTKYSKEAGDLLMQTAMMLQQGHPAGQAMQQGEMEGQMSMGYTNNRASNREAVGREVR